MIQYSKVTENPSTEPVTLNEIKSQVKMEGTSLDDSYLTNLGKTARQLCESYSGLSFVSQERTIKMDRFPIDCNYISSWKNHIIVPYGPVISIDSFTYIDSDGETQTLTEDDDFIVDNSSDLCRIEPVNSWPTPKDRINAITIVYTAGYSSVPEIVKDAILRTAADLYEFRTNKVSGQLTSVPVSAQMLLDTIKVTWNANY